MVREAGMVLLAFVLVTRGADYHVSTGGNDSASGTSGAPFRTLAKAAATARSGDRILLERGSVFRESVNFAATNITLDAYGSGSEIPIISGSSVLSGWQRQGTSSIYAATVTPRVYNLFVNNQLMTVARWPNSGWLRMKNGSVNATAGYALIPCEALKSHPRNANDYWNGAQVRWRRWSWWFETRRITDYDAGLGELRIDDSNDNMSWAKPTEGWGFYIDNKFQELDTAGEWYYDSAAGKVFLWAPGGEDPSALLVEAGIILDGPSVRSAQVLHVGFRHFAKTGLSISGATTVRWCRFEGIGSDSGGVALSGTWDMQSVRIADNLFRDNLNLGISCVRNPATTLPLIIENDTLINTGCVPGYGGSGTWHAAAIVLSVGTEMRVRHCKIEKCGYAGVIVGKPGNFVDSNLIIAAMSTLNDGGGIYTNCDRTTIRGNIILNTKGDLESSGPWANLGHGIWPEFLGDFKQTVIEGNTCAFSGASGLFLPNNFQCTIRNNVFYDNAICQADLSGDSTNSSTGRTQNLPQNNTFTSNVFFAAKAGQGALRFRPEYNYGTMTGNYFCNPQRDSMMLNYGTGNRLWTVYRSTLASWSSTYSWADKNPQTDRIKRPATASASDLRGTSRLVYNDRDEYVSIDLGNGVYQDLDGNRVSGIMQLGAYRSQVLVHTGEELSVNKRQEGRHLPRSLFRMSGRQLSLKTSGFQAVNVMLLDARGRVVGRMDEGRAEFPSAAGTRVVIVEYQDGSGIRRHERGVITMIR